MVTSKDASESTATEIPSAGNPLWYKDAVIYQIHVRAYHDANGDGIGDFAGLTQKLDYIQSLGVNTIWLLPFFLSPLRDDGYDIADYTRLNPAYGTLKDFEKFLEEAHRRDLRVITEMVMNHTSDQHAWFQQSRRAKPGSKWRDFYVWSDNEDRYSETRIIFQDFERSNWTWDPVANAYYWHRFYSHQPDLNFDNPDVHTAMFEAIDFWFDKGVDGVRLDAIPYLYEREGTNCENLPETHAFIKQLRKHIDEKYVDKMLLAEANQWPEDAAAYFGDGDESHMNFHFPLMPRLFMAVEREDRFPIIDILEQTPKIPDNCQWGVFLRNHDELTLEMVTDEERDYMYRAYAEDPRARINLGIRRRLAPLMRDDRRKIELMNGLLLSMPGSPVIYYGDEIAMGDNIYLGDRDAVRTPMQWNDDRNAGFSRANPQRLFLPVIIDTLYHYASRNVEVEQSRPASMLWWMRRIIGLRKQHPAFGRGTIEFLTPDNGKILAYLRESSEETVLVVVNLSRSVQCAELDLSRFRGRVPVELFAESRFPMIGELPYFLTLGPYGFYWFRIEGISSDSSTISTPLPEFKVVSRWDEIFEGKLLRRLESLLPGYLKQQRWFAGKARVMQRTNVIDVLTIEDVPALTAAVKRFGSTNPESLAETRVLFVQVEYAEGDPDVYLLPVVFAQGHQSENIVADRPSAGLLTVQRSRDGGLATLCDTTYECEFWLLLFDALARQQAITGQRGVLEAVQTSACQTLSTDLKLEATVHGGEQSNTSAILGRQLILKLIRRLNEGENPDFEIGRFLTERTELRCVPRVAGALEYRFREGKRYTIAVVHEFVPNQGDAWVYTLDELGRFLERVETEITGPPSTTELPLKASPVTLSTLEVPPKVQELIGPYLHAAQLLGERTAEMHLALASGTETAFAPEAFSKLYQRSLYQAMRAEARKMFTLLRRRQKTLPGEAMTLAEQLLSREADLLDRYSRILNERITALRARCHGDYHLGQVLYTGKDFVIIDFEGEPARSISERRIKRSPLRDVAGMLRSFHYATHAVFRSSHGEALLQSANSPYVKAWASVWYNWCAAAFLKSYLSSAASGQFLPHDHAELQTLLDAYLLEKAVYELGYELNNRPDWVAIPLEGISQQLKS
ncbi:maltose alpha-D-glucosyltransferase [bacterium]|nr:maltose alpha-D-glucosyltransferase [bacterium]